MHAAGGSTRAGDTLNEPQPPTDPPAIGFLISEPNGLMAMWRAAFPAIGLREGGATVVVSDVGQISPLGTFVLALAGQPGRPVAWEPDAVVFTGRWVHNLLFTPATIDDMRAEGQRVYADVVTGNMPARVWDALAHTNGVLVPTNTLADGFQRRLPRTPVYVAPNIARPAEPAEVAPWRTAFGIESAPLGGTGGADANDGGEFARSTPPATPTLTEGETRTDDHSH